MTFLCLHCGHKIRGKEYTITADAKHDGRILVKWGYYMCKTCYFFFYNYMDIFAKRRGTMTDLLEAEV
jgi:hypothetical protein